MNPKYSEKQLNEDCDNRLSGVVKQFFNVNELTRMQLETFNSFRKVSKENLPMVIDDDRQVERSVHFTSQRLAEIARVMPQILGNTHGNAEFTWLPSTESPYFTEISSSIVSNNPEIVIINAQELQFPDSVEVIKKMISGIKRSQPIATIIGFDENEELRHAYEEAGATLFAAISQDIRTRYDKLFSVIQKL